jgi:hypothetical protein
METAKDRLERWVKVKRGEGKERSRTQEGKGGCLSAYLFLFLPWIGRIFALNHLSIIKYAVIFICLPFSVGRKYGSPGPAQLL